MCRGFLCHFGNPKYTGDITLCEINNYMRQAQSSITIRRRPKGISKTEVYYRVSDASTETSTDSAAGVLLNRVPMSGWSKEVNLLALDTTKTYLWRMELTTYTDNTTSASYSIYNTFDNIRIEAVPDFSRVDIDLRPNSLINKTVTISIPVHIYLQGEEIYNQQGVRALDIEKVYSTSTGIVANFEEGREDNLSVVQITASEGWFMDKDASENILNDVVVVAKFRLSPRRQIKCRIEVHGVVAKVWEPINVTNLFAQPESSSAAISKGLKDGLYPNGASLYAVDTNGNKIDVQWVYSPVGETTTDHVKGRLSIMAYDMTSSFNPTYISVMVQAGESLTYRIANSAKALFVYGTSAQYDNIVNSIFI